jgi:hypothetical protein
MSLIYPTWLKQIITEANNEIVDVKRLIGIGLAGQFAFLSTNAVVFNHQAFDPVGYGTGMAAVVAGVGVAIGVGKAGETSA